jgi:hypothetical protein
VTQPTAQTQIAYWKQGADIIEACLAKAVAADPREAPIPLDATQAALWHRAQAEAYRHCLEMMGPVAPETTDRQLRDTIEATSASLRQG